MLIPPLRKIGIFDSGLGGLTVLSAIHSLLPDEDIVYFGDTARVPYGTKSKKTIIKYSEEILEFLLGLDVKLIVIACNTASAYALEHLRVKTKIPVLGVIEPGVDSLIESCPDGEKAALIATTATVSSKSYEKILNQKNPKIMLMAKACPLFVPLVEEGLLRSKITEYAIHHYLEKIKKKDIQDIILGCTHYPLLKPKIKELYPEFNLIDSSLEAAKALKKYLSLKNLLNASETKGKVEIYVSDITGAFRGLVKLFLGKPRPKIFKKVL